MPFLEFISFIFSFLSEKVSIHPPAEYVHIRRKVIFAFCVRSGAAGVHLRRKVEGSAVGNNGPVHRMSQR